MVEGNSTGTISTSTAAAGTVEKALNSKLDDLVANNRPKRSNNKPRGALQQRQNAKQNAKQSAKQNARQNARQNPRQNPANQKKSAGGSLRQKTRDPLVMSLDDLMNSQAAAATMKSDTKGVKKNNRRGRSQFTQFGRRKVVLSETTQAAQGGGSRRPAPPAVRNQSSRNFSGQNYGGSARGGGRRASSSLAMAEQRGSSLSQGGNLLRGASAAPPSSPSSANGRAANRRRRNEKSVINYRSFVNRPLSGPTVGLPPQIQGSARRRNLTINRTRSNRNSERLRSIWNPQTGRMMLDNNNNVGDGRGRRARGDMMMRSPPQFVDLQSSQQALPPAGVYVYQQGLSSQQQSRRSSNQNIPRSMMPNHGSPQASQGGNSWRYNYKQQSPPVVVVPPLIENNNVIGNSQQRRKYNSSQPVLQQQNNSSNSSALDALIVENASSSQAVITQSDRILMNKIRVMAQLDKVPVPLWGQQKLSIPLPYGTTTASSSTAISEQPSAPTSSFSVGSPGKLGDRF